MAEGNPARVTKPEFFKNDAEREAAIQFYESMYSPSVTRPCIASPHCPDSQVGARICNGLGIMRACLETQKLEQLEARMDEIADRVARDRTNAARERYQHHEA
jgi:hypothetical protein